MDKTQIQELLTSLVNDNKKKKTKRKWNFSKCLMAGVFLVWAATIGISFFLLINNHPEPTALVDKVQIAFMTGFVGYTGKSAMENHHKIKNGLEENEYIVEEEDE